jgi:hypothetical protein
MTIRKLPGSQIESNTITITQIQTTAVTNIVTQAGPRVSSLIYPGNDTAGNTVGGQTVYINGSGFETNNAIYINGNAVPSKSFISASNLSFTTPALSAGIYPVYVINTDSGSTAIFVPGYIASAEPSWVTSAGSLNASQDEGSAWSYSLSATGDAPITYALAVGSSLPSGISLAANGLVSGTLSSPPGTETTYTFSVVASDAQNQDSTRQFTVTTTSGEGALFANNVLLIHADGTNNQNNHAFLDSSNNNFTITRNGNATQGSFSPFSQTGWSYYFPNGPTGTSSVSFPDTTGFTFGSGDFTVEAWVFMTHARTGAVGGTGVDVAAVYAQCANIANNGNRSHALQIVNNTVRFYYSVNGTGDNFADFNASSIPLNQWHHIAVSRSGNTLYGFLNGTLISSMSFTATIFDSSANLYVGTFGAYPISDSYTGLTFPGYISNLRITKGAGLYTSSFTPSTTPLTTTVSSGTVSLLTCQSNRFVDNSVNALAASVTTSPSVQAFSPFAPTAAYSTANVGSSLYLDGTGDYLQATSGVSTQFDTGSAFTVECWVYQLSYASDGNIFGVSGSTVDWNATTGIYLNWYTYSGNLYWQTSLGNGQAVSLITATLPGINQWHHFAVGFNGTTTRMWINGTSVGTSTQGYTRPSGTNRWQVGSTGGGASILNGYISGLRYVKGTDVYGVGNSSITVPTAPLTNIANTSLLLNFTNAGIFDQTAKNVLETVGDAKVSTAQYKYGTGSMYFDGTGDFLTIPDNINLRMGTGNFTMEFWWYPVSIAGYQTPLDKGYTGAGALLFQTGNGDGRLIIYASGSGVITSNTAVSTNTWTHVALVRNSSTMTLYQNGNSVGSVSNSTDFSDATIMGIGSNASGAGGTRFVINGYLDDLRITRGYARYTSNFTAPSSAFKDK